MSTPIKHYGPEFLEALAADCQAPDPAQVAPVSLLEAIDYALNQAPCECPHSMRFERGEHMSGCYLFDLNVEYAKTAPAIPAPEGGELPALPDAMTYAAARSWAVTKEWCRGWDDARAALAAPAPQAPAEPSPLEQLNILRQMLQDAVAELKATPQAPVALTVQQIIDATVQIDVTQPAWIVKLARAIEAAHGIPAPQTKEPKA